MTGAVMGINAVRIEDRHRQDMGDLKALADSIERVGLLHPIVVTEDGRLVAGGRRLVACATLGWGEVPVTVVSSLNSAAALLHAERDENTCRKDMAPSERVALGRALETLEAPAAAERVGGRPPKTAGTVPAVSVNGRVRDVVGDAVGWSGHTYQRAKAVVVAAEHGDPVAAEALTEMDATGNVKGAWQKTQGAASSSRVAPIETGRGRVVAEKDKRRVFDLDATLRGMCRALPDLHVNHIRAVCSPEELVQINRSIGDSITALRKFRTELERGR